MALSNITNAVSSYAGIAGGLVNKIGALAGTNGDNSAIRERYLNGFIGDTPQFVPNVFSRLFDEPTYLTFRLAFDFDNNLEHNSKSTSSLSNSTPKTSKLFDRMPEPFLAMPEPENNDDFGYYSTYSYLRNGLGERRRAAMLKQFISSLKDIQDNYPYYFTEVLGIETLLQTNPEKGIRILDGDNNRIVIKCLEGLDQKITQLTQMYRKIVWDDVYQRWILPDMMRYFTLRIYISEMRLFHSYTSDKWIWNKKKDAKGFLIDLSSAAARSSRSTTTAEGRDWKDYANMANNILSSASAISANMLGDGNVISKYVDGASSVLQAAGDVTELLQGDAFLCDNAINDVMPTICIECRMCEFDIKNTGSHLATLSSSKQNTSPAAPEIAIKVGNIRETMVFPLQANLELKKDDSKYVMKKILSYSNYVSDEFLMTEATWKNVDWINDGQDSSADSSTTDNTTGVADERNISKKGVRINGSYIGGKKENGNSKSKSDNSIIESYNQFSPDKVTAAVTLATGLTGAFFTNLNSTAIDGAAAENLKEQVANGFSPIDDDYDSLAYTTKTDSETGETRVVHKGFSEAVSNSYEDASNNGKNQRGSVINDDYDSLAYTTKIDSETGETRIVHKGFSEAVSNSYEDASNNGKNQRGSVINDAALSDSSYMEVVYDASGSWKGYSSAQQNPSLLSMIPKTVQDVSVGFSEAISNSYEDASNNGAKYRTTTIVDPGVKDTSYMNTAFDSSVWKGYSSAQQNPSLLSEISKTVQDVSTGFSEAISNSYEDASNNGKKYRTTVIEDPGVKDVSYMATAFDGSMWKGYSSAQQNSTSTNALKTYDPMDIKDVSTGYSSAVKDASVDSSLAKSLIKMEDSSYIEMSYVTKTDSSTGLSTTKYKGYSTALEDSGLSSIIIGMKVLNTSDVSVGFSEAISNSYEDTSNNGKEYRTSVIVDSSATKKDASIAPLSMVGDSSFSKATTSTNKIQEVIASNGAEAVFSAATTLKSTLDYIAESQDIKSMATSEEMRTQVVATLTQAALKNIATSTATDENSKALRDLANLIIDNAQASQATSAESASKVDKTAYVKDPGKSKATTGEGFNSTAFNFLNN